MEFTKLLDLISSSPEKQFHLLTILLDKGLLALLVALFGLVGAFLIERYKSALAREQELAKIIVPAVIELMKDSEVLFQVGKSVTYKLDDEYEALFCWWNEIAGRFKPLNNNDAKSPGNQDLADLEIEASAANRIKLRQFLMDSTDHKTIKNMVASEDFWNKPINMNGYKIPESPYSSLFSDTARHNKSKPEPPKTLPWVFCKYFIEPRKEYYREWESLLLKIMRTLPSESRRDKKAYDAILTALENAKKAVEDYPQNDVIKLAGADIGALTSLSVAHCALITQLRKFVRTA